MCSSDLTSVALLVMRLAKWLLPFARCRAVSRLPRTLFPMHSICPPFRRREFLHRSALGAGAVALGAWLAAAVPASLAAEAKDDPLAAWRSGVKISPVAPKDGRHTMHSYFNTCPESPDGKFVLFYASGAADGHRGEVIIQIGRAHV